MAAYSALRRLNVSNTGILLSSMFLRLKGYVRLLQIYSLSPPNFAEQELDYLDVSDNKFDKAALDTIADFLASVGALKTYGFHLKIHEMVGFLMTFFLLG